MNVWDERKLAGGSVNGHDPFGKSVARTHRAENAHSPQHTPGVPLGKLSLRAEEVHVRTFTAALKGKPGNPEASSVVTSIEKLVHTLRKNLEFWSLHEILHSHQNE